MNDAAKRQIADRAFVTTKDGVQGTEERSYLLAALAAYVLILLLFCTPQMNWNEPCGSRIEGISSS